MPRYKVLRSAAHNWAHSFVSDTNMGPHDFVACYLLRAARTSGVTEFAVDLCGGDAVLPAPLRDDVSEAVASFRRGFVPHVERSGAAAHMIGSAEMRVRVVWPLDGVSAVGAVRGYVECEVEITDDRGRRHRGESRAEWSCSTGTLPW